jgi:hypothetical protein
MPPVIQMTKVAAESRPARVSPARWEDFFVRWAQLLQVRRDLERMEAEWEAERDELLPLMIDPAKLKEIRAD